MYITAGGERFFCLENAIFSKEIVIQLKKYFEKRDDFRYENKTI